MGIREKEKALTVPSIPFRDRAHARQLADKTGFIWVRRTGTGLRCMCGFLTRADARRLGSGWWCGERTEGITGAQATGGDSSVYSAAAWSYCVV